MLAAALITVKIGVFGLFQPTELDLRAVAGQTLVVEKNGQKQSIERGEIIRLGAGDKAYGRGGIVTSFLLSVPGKIHREFFGKLDVREEQGHLVPVIEMDLETAVASVADAEMVAVPTEAMKAQVVASRSYLLATRGRHDGYDFCDTTHCQFLRSRPRAGTLAAVATEQTKGLTITHNGKVLAALYSANCGGHTRSLEEAGWNQAEYPFFGVMCPVKGPMEGHAIGLCQRGAMELAKRGSNFRDILAYFFPATALTPLAH